MYSFGYCAALKFRTCDAPLDSIGWTFGALLLQSNNGLFDILLEDVLSWNAGLLFQFCAGMYVADH